MALLTLFTMPNHLIYVISDFTSPPSGKNASKFFFPVRFVLFSVCVCVRVCKLKRWALSKRKSSHFFKKSFLAIFMPLLVPLSQGERENHQRQMSCFLPQGEQRKFENSFLLYLFSTKPYSFDRKAEHI